MHRRTLLAGPAVVLLVAIVGVAPVDAQVPSTTTAAEQGLLTALDLPPDWVQGAPPAANSSATESLVRAARTDASCRPFAAAVTDRRTAEPTVSPVFSRGADSARNDTITYPNATFAGTVMTRYGATGTAKCLKRALPELLRERLTDEAALGPGTKIESVRVKSIDPLVDMASAAQFADGYRVHLTVRPRSGPSRDLYYDDVLVQQDAVIDHYAFAAFDAPPDQIRADAVDRSTGRVVQAYHTALQPRETPALAGALQPVPGFGYGDPTAATQDADAARGVNDEYRSGFARHGVWIDDRELAGELLLWEYRPGWLERPGWGDEEIALLMQSFVDQPVVVIAKPTLGGTQVNVAVRAPEPDRYSTMFAWYEGNVLVVFLAEDEWSPGAPSESFVAEFARRSRLATNGAGR